MRHRSKILLASAFGLGVFGAAYSAHAACPGVLGNWSYRAPVTLDNESGVLHSYLALVTVDTAALVAAGKLQAGGGDLRFTDDACNVLDAWVDSGLGTTTTKIWVKLRDGLSSGRSSIFLYYGNPHATRSNDPTPLFGPNLAALYTFTEGDGTKLEDHVGNSHLTLIGDVAWTTGFRPGTHALTGFGPNSRALRTISSPRFGRGDFSVVSVVLPTETTSTHGIVGTYGSAGSSGWGLNLAGSSFSLLTAQEASQCSSQAEGSVSSAGGWHFLGASRAAGIHTLVVNNRSRKGPSSCGEDACDVSRGPTGPLQIGNASESGPSGHFAGSIAFTALYSPALTDRDSFVLRDSLAIRSRVAVNVGSEQGRPGAPQAVEIAAGRGAATFSFAPPPGDPSSYTATCDPGGKTVASSLAPPFSLSGLTNGTRYMCTVHASNALGDGPESLPVEVVPGALPGIPTNVMASVDGTKATISFVPPVDDGDTPISVYSASCQNGAISRDGVGSPIELEWLADGTYSCTIAARNAKGTGPASAVVTFEVKQNGGASSSSGGSSNGGGEGDGGSSSSGASGAPLGSGASPDGVSNDGTGGGCHAASTSESGGVLGLLVAAIAALLRRRSRAGEAAVEGSARDRRGSRA